MSNLQSSLGPDVSAPLARSLHEHWGLFLAEGIILTVLGLGAIIVPVLAGLATALFLGWLFLIAGIVGLVFTLQARKAPGFGWSLLSALVAIVAGAILLWSPLQSLITLTYVLIAYFIVDGIAIIFLSIEHRRELSGRWEWMLINGLVDLVLAGIIIAGLPGTLVWALGLLVGIDLVFGGTTLIAFAFAARKGATGPTSGVSAAL
ncbi:MAG: HdeD family acid-resistance protein [Beijerinckiaceae bacterium]|nr:HdeD family acid-resistance protein [Beijerinckiaceae bacterium]